jgi:hypothetical protein
LNLPPAVVGAQRADVLSNLQGDVNRMARVEEWASGVQDDAFHLGTPRTLPLPAARIGPRQIELDHFAAAPFHFGN